MRVYDYSKLAIRTSPKKDQLVHCVLGLASELSEFYESSHIEELGDLCWYLNEGCDAIDKNLDDLDDHEPDIDPTVKLSEHIGHLADVAKRNQFYGEEINKEKVFILLSKIKSEIWEIAKEYDYDMEDVLEKNIIKLEVRYPELRFERERALNRNLAEERKVLDD